MRSVLLTGNRAFVAMLFVVLFMRAAVPSGFMFVTDASGLLTLAACPGQGAVLLADNPHALSADVHHGHGSDSFGIQAVFSATDCGYSAAVSPLLQPDNQAIPGQFIVSGSQLLPIELDVFVVDPNYFAHIARGPPAYS